MRKLPKLLFVSTLSFIAVFLSLNESVMAQLAQQFTGTSELTKNDVKGRYFGTYVTDDGSSTVFYASEKGGFNAYIFDNKGEFSKVSSGAEADQEYSTLQGAEYTMGDYQDMPVYKGDMIVGSASWTGKLKILKGPLYLNASEKFVYGPGFEEKESFKPKVNDTWNTKRIGYRAYAPDPKVRLEKSGKKGSFEFLLSGPYVFAPDNGSIQAAGVITEKVSIKNPPETNGNRIAIFSIPGSDPDNVQENIITLPYAMQAIGVGITANNDFAVMVMPLNAPSTYKPHKKLVAPEGKRNRLYVARFDQENNLRDTLSIPSTSMVVDFQYHNDGINDFIIGMGTDKDKNWRWHFAGMELNRIQFIKLGDDGKVLYHKTYDEEEIESKLMIPGAKKNSHKMKFPEEPVFTQFETLANGNHFMYGELHGYGHAMLVDKNGNLIHYYLITHADLEKNRKWGSEFHTRGNKIYMSLSDQPSGLSNETQTDVTYTAYTKITTTKQMFEIFHVTQLFVFNGDNGDVKQQWLGDAGKEWYTCGNTPVMFLEDAMYVTGRSKGPKGKEIFVSKYSY